MHRCTRVRKALLAASAPHSEPAAWRNIPWPLRYVSDYPKIALKILSSRIRLITPPMAWSSLVYIQEPMVRCLSFSKGLQGK